MKQETIEEASERFKEFCYWGCKKSFIEGAKWQQDNNKYSEEEVEPLLSFIRDVKDDWDCDNDSHKYGTSCRRCDAEKILEQFKKK